ncbi:hypothetical protein HanIR_Chr16g0825001 [Helianthus annuus]|nr:hypothetical protein HanIR_Chr16g0825001 [Helianthus annuus]
MNRCVQLYHAVIDIIFVSQRSPLSLSHTYITTKLQKRSVYTMKLEIITSPPV